MTKRKSDAVYYSIIALMTFLPSTTRFNLLRTVVVAVLFFGTNSGGIRKIAMGDKKTAKIVFLLLFSPLFSVAIVFMVTLGEVNVSLFVHEYTRMIFNVLVLLTVRRLTVTYKTCYKIAAIVLLVNFAIQLLQYNGNETVMDFIRGYYAGGAAADEWTHLDLSQEGEGARFGSIYVNPNVYLIIPMLTLGIILYADRKKSSPLNYLLLIITFLSCVLTGSRTAIIVMAVIVVVYFFKFADVKKALLLFAVAVVGVAVYLSNYSDVGRAFELGSLDSLTTKFKLFYWYWQTANPLYWFTGSIGASVQGIDSEIGHIYSWYGLLGAYWYVLLIKYIIQTNRDRLFSAVSTIAFVLVGFTSSVFLNFPVFTFFAAFVFAKKVENRLD